MEGGFHLNCTWPAESSTSAAAMCTLKGQAHEVVTRQQNVSLVLLHEILGIAPFTGASSMGAQCHIAFVHWIWQPGNEQVGDLIGREVQLDESSKVVYSTEMFQNKKLYYRDVDRVLAADVGVAMLKVRGARRPPMTHWALRIKAISEVVLSNSQAPTMIYRTCCWGEWCSKPCEAGPALTCSVCLLDWHLDCDAAAQCHIDALSGGASPFLKPQGCSLESSLGHAIPQRLLGVADICSWCKWSFCTRPTHGLRAEQLMKTYVGMCGSYGIYWDCWTMATPPWTRCYINLKHITLPH